MEDLISTQEQIAAAIGQLYSNFKKDGSFHGRISVKSKKAESAILNYDLPAKPREEIKPSTPNIRPATPSSGSETPQQGLSVQARGGDSKTDEMLQKQSSNFKAFEHMISDISLDTISEKWKFDHLLRTIHWELDSELGQRNPEYESHFFQSEKK
ncbi:unnamed protein product [Arctia plantaginis]|uniref:Uncharacterized protein n=1 Tax=Arctia plantaginis TaxID=874455 RepID=A0A8S1ATZ2_ARCPL|nr:unnamed protein product [Arctia plantaginis]